MEKRFVTRSKAKKEKRAKKIDIRRPKYISSIVVAIFATG
jgi:hypothetical protein